MMKYERADIREETVSTLACGMCMIKHWTLALIINYIHCMVNISYQRQESLVTSYRAVYLCDVDLIGLVCQETQKLVSCGGYYYYNFFH